MRAGHPGAATPHLIQQALGARGLGSMAREEDALSKKEETPPISLGVNHIPYRDKAKAQELLEGKSTDEILNLRGIGVKYNHSGKKILTAYEAPSIYYKASDIGIDENSLIEGVTKVLSGGMNLRNSELTSTGSIKTVLGDIIIDGKSQISDMSSIEEHQGMLFLEIPKEISTKEFIEKIGYKPTYRTGGVIRL